MVSARLVLCIVVFALSHSISCPVWYHWKFHRPTNCATGQPDQWCVR